MTMHPAGDPQYELSPADQKLLDQLVETGFDARVIDSLSAPERQRARKLMDLLGLLKDYPVEDGDDALIHATMARIDRYEEERAARLSFDSHLEEAARPARRLIRLPDFISVAAVILIAAGVLWPMTTHLRNRAIDTACANNLRQVGYAFSQYAGDYDGAVPVALAGMSAWDGFFSNVINLGPLVEGDYCEAGHLKCPGGDDHAHAGYSYQWQVPGTRLVWGAQPRMTLVLGDQNPLIDAFREGETRPALTISFNHGGRGQNVLSTDGSTMWLEQPVIGRDNIWLPQGQSVLKPGMAPASGDDVFLAH